MRDERKTKKQLVVELVELRQRLAELKASKTPHGQTEDPSPVLYTSSLDGIVRTRLDGQITECNQAYAEMLGYSREELEGSEYQKLMPAKWHAFHDSLLKEVMERGYSYEYEQEYVKKGGAVFPVSLRTWRIDDEEGNPTGIWSIVRDITERKRVEEEFRHYSERLEELVEDRTRTLRESGENFRALADNAGDGILIGMEEGTHVYANKRAAEITGYSIDELLKISIKDLAHPDEFEKVAKRYRNTLAGKPVLRELETAIVRKDGKSVPIELMATKTVWRGQPAIMILIRDVTRRKKAEEALRSSEEKYRAIFNQSPDCIYLTDLEGNILDANPALLKRAGMSLEQVRQKSIWDFFAGEDPEEVLRAAALLMEGHEVKTLHVQAHISQEDILEYEINAAPLIENGEVVASLSVARDVTERRRLEERIQQQGQLAAIGRLAGGIAHDFNNFLMAIMLYAQILLRKPHLPSDLAPNVETILNESRRAAQLVRQILDFSRRSMMETRAVDILSLTKRIFDFLREALPENIHLVLELEADEHAAPFAVNADPARIRQVIANLALNARDAMPEGGELRIGLSRVEVKPGVEPPIAGMPVGDWACLTVSDTGTGMTEEVRSHLFEPFFTTKEPGKGAGLGLAQAYGIVKQHKGHIGVETGAGQGTTFRIYLPVYQAEMEEAPRGAEELPQGQGETILLVEDEATVREAGREILESLGYRVLTAANGQEALEAHRAIGEVDLVLTDLVMPEMGGVELIQELRKAHPRVKMLAITGYPQTEGPAKLKELGVHDVIQKPFEASVLAETIRRSLDAD